MSDKDQQENQSTNAAEDKTADVERAIDWVDELVKKEETSAAGAENSSLSLDDSIPVEDLPEWARADQTASGPPEDDGLAWIDDSDSGMAATEMPTLQYPGERARAKIEEPDTLPPNQQPAYSQEFDESQPLRNVNDAMAWLDKLAASKGEPVEELPTQIIPKDIPLDYLNMTDENDVPNPENKMDVLDDPISWLEQLAADQDTPLEELPSVADRLLASEIISQIDDSQGTAVPQVDPPEVAVPLEDALLYLEQVAQDEGVQLKNVALDPSIDSYDLDLWLMQIDQLAAGDISKLPEAMMATAVAKEIAKPTQPEVDWNNLSDAMPEDPDEALAWMESMADEADVEAMPAVAAELDSQESDFAELDTLPPTTVGAQKEDEILDEMPEDPDEAMAWLEQVSAESAASVESESDPQPSESANETDSAPELPVQNDAALLADVSQALANGDVDEALAGYKAALTKGDDLDAVVAGLETAVAANPEIGRLRYLLGDAYLKNGQTQKAMEAYQQGSLDNL